MLWNDGNTNGVSVFSAVALAPSRRKYADCYRNHLACGFRLAEGIENRSLIEVHILGCKLWNCGENLIVRILRS